MTAVRDIVRGVVRSVVRGITYEVTNSPILFKVEYTDTQFAFKFKAPAGSTLNIYEGDGTMTPVAGNDDTWVTHTTTYAAPGTYYFYVEGDWVDITSIHIGNMTMASGSIDRWGEMTGITWLLISNTAMYGDVSNLVTLTSGTLFSLQESEVTGDVSTLRVLTGLTTLRAYDTDVTFDSPALWGMTGQLRFDNCGMPATMVDNMVEAFQDLSGCEIKIDRNTERTSASDVAFISLVSNGNELTIDETDSIMTLGPELHTDANAASDPNGNEADAITGWTPTGLTGTGANVFESQQVVKATGDSAFKTDANDTPTSGAQIEKEYTTVAASIYRISQRYRHIGVGGNWGIQIDDSQTIDTIASAEVEFRKVVHYTPAADETLHHEIKEYSTTNDGGVYVDDISVRNVILP